MASSPAKTREVAYHAQTTPALAHYEQKRVVRPFDGSGETDTVCNSVQTMLLG